MKKLDSMHARSFLGELSAIITGGEPLPCHSIEAAIDAIDCELGKVLRYIHLRDLPSERGQLPEHLDCLIEVHTSKFWEAISTFAGSCQEFFVFGDIGFGDVYQVEWESLQDVACQARKGPNGSWFVSQDLCSAFYVNEAGWIAFTGPAHRRHDKLIIDLDRDWIVEQAVCETDRDPLHPDFPLQVRLSFENCVTKETCHLVLRGLGSYLHVDQLSLLWSPGLRILDIRSRQWEHWNYHVSIGIADGSSGCEIVETNEDMPPHDCFETTLFAEEVLIER